MSLTLSDVFTNESLQIINNADYKQLRPLVKEIMDIYRPKAQYYIKNRYKLDKDFHNKLLNLNIKRYVKKERCALCNHFPKGCRCDK